MTFLAAFLPRRVKIELNACSPGGMARKFTHRRETNGWSWRVVPFWRYNLPVRSIHMIETTYLRESPPHTHTQWTTTIATEATKHDMYLHQIRPSTLKFCWIFASTSTIRSYMDFPAVTVHKSMGHVLESHGVTLKKKLKLMEQRWWLQRWGLQNTLPETNIAPENGWLEY